MVAYYNEIDKHAVAWLKELIKQGIIADGDVDDRSIKDVCAADLLGYTQCHFFAGIGGWSIALRQAGWPDDRPVWTGSCPCQPFSSAGQRKGFADERHLWPEFFRLIEACRPVTVFGEQVASKDGLAWFDAVRTDLEKANYSWGGQIYALRASVRRISDKGSIGWQSGWPTPTNRDYKDGLETPNVPTNALLGRTAWLTGPARLTASGEILTGSGAGIKNGGQLNPDLPRWLMGYSTEHLSCGVTAMQSVSRRRKPS